MLMALTILAYPSLTYAHTLAASAKMTSTLSASAVSNAMTNSSNIALNAAEGNVTQVSPGNGTLNAAISDSNPGDVLQLEAGLYVGTDRTSIPGTDYYPGFAVLLSITIQGV